jgi:transmembrane sensor
MNKQIYAEACDWFVDFRTGDVGAAERRRFDEWIRTSPEHLRAYLEVTEIWQDAPLVDGNRTESAADLARAARESAAELIELERAEAAQPSGLREVPPPRRSRRGLRWLWLAPVASPALAAGLALLAAGVAIGWLTFGPGAGYRTSTGEQRSIALDDGSTVQLNTRSKLRVRFGESERVVELDEGQALFDVVTDASRPFVVRSGGAEVTVLGTRFDVYRRETGTTITVIEGRVAAKSAGGAAVLLSAGEQATLAPDVAAKPRLANVASVTSWTQRRLVFNAMPLPQVIDEFNRYNERRMVLATPEAVSFEVSGVYSSTDPSLLIRFLRAQPGLAVRETPSEILISREAETK